MKFLLVMFLVISFSPIFAQESNQFNQTFSDKNLIEISEKVTSLEENILKNSTVILDKMNSIEKNQDVVNENLVLIKDNQNNSDVLGIVGIILAIVGIGTSSGAFIFAYKGDKEIQNLIHQLGLDVKNLISGSDVQITPAEISASPVRPQIKSEEISPLRDKISSLLEKLPEEKLSSLLHEGKLIGLELKDSKMVEWIQDELDGYQSVSKDPKKKKMIEKNPPENRSINGHFYLDADIPDYRPTRINRRVLMTKPISEVETTISRLEKREIQTTIPYTISGSNTSLDGRRVDLLLPIEEWRSIIIRTRQKLSRLLEDHLFKK